MGLAFMAFGTPSGSVAVPAHPPKEHGFQGSHPCTTHPGALHRSGQSRMLKAETHSHRTASPKASFLVDRGHRAWPGGLPASREVKWGLRRVRHIVPATGKGAFASLTWLQVAGISEVILSPQLRLLLLNCQCISFLVQE